MPLESRAQRSVFTSDRQKAEPLLAMRGSIHVSQELGDGSGRDQRGARETRAIGELVLAAVKSDAGEKIVHLLEPGFGTAGASEGHRDLPQKHLGVQVLADLIDDLQKFDQRR